MDGVRAAAVVDELVVAVGSNVSKRSWFTPEERVEMLTEACAGWAGVSVALFGGLLVDFCREQQASVVVKGLRGDTSIPARAAADNDYADRWTLALDLMIIVRTAIYLVKH